MNGWAQDRAGAPAAIVNKTLDRALVHICGAERLTRGRWPPAFVEGVLAEG